MSDWVQPTIEEQEEMRKAGEAERAQAERLAAERRIATRMKLHAKVTLSSASNFFMGLTENISEGGIFVSTLSPPAMGESVELAIAVEDGEPVPVVGEVRWIRMDDAGHPTGCGVQFLNLTDDARRAIEAMMIGLEKEPLLHEV
jgi:uncharacterized protein (TIGR02266 family)